MRNVEIVEQRQKGGPEIVQGLRKSGDPDRIDLALARKQDPRGLHEVIATVGAAHPERDSAHGIGDVLVEPREEAETVLSRKIHASANAATGYRHAARLAAESGIALVHRYRKAAFGQLMRRAESAHPAAEDRYRLLRWHGYDLLLLKQLIIAGIPVRDVMFDDR
jgi:hypothetical protein